MHGTAEKGNGARTSVCHGRKVQVPLHCAAASERLPCTCWSPLSAVFLCYAASCLLRPCSHLETLVVLRLRPKKKNLFFFQLNCLQRFYYLPDYFIWAIVRKCHRLGNLKRNLFLRVLGSGS